MDNGASSYRRFLAGDNEGLAEIVREYSDGLIFYINSYVQNISLAEEIMEDVFVEIALKRPKYKEKSSFKTWLYAIARYTSIDCLKKNSRYYDTPVDEMHNISDEQDLEKSYIREERKILLHKVIVRLVPDYQQVLYLIFFENFSNSEAAKILKKSDKQMKNLVFRAKQALKKELEKEGFEYEEL
ncbi:sigma-70 family RNA polymerase sigma factor [Ruminococcus sp.]|uniref:RNA polymerase sigma factor n=1 Tax=Ruminococcus sp. TaxID=41978 RepID=UPI0025EC1DE3|nr:sigma-70 family RNA polymerase sigma factor [Ruminococcus sp.]